MGSVIQTPELKTVMIVSFYRTGLFGDSIARFIETIWLFTLSDLKSIVVPSTAFAILTLLSGPVLTTDPSPQVSKILAKIPQIIFWTWINLLPFTIDNQRQPNSIKEDAANKPWRPMPSRRLSERTALKLVLCGYTLAMITSIILGGLQECFVLIALGFWYNSLGGADVHWTVKNFINACGFLAFALGATDVAQGTQNSGSTFILAAKYWFFVLGAVIFSSIQVQDMYDQIGDRTRGRKTLPLVIGDRAARMTIAVSVMFWSVFCPIFWRLSSRFHAVSMIFGGFIALRTLLRPSVLEDRKTFRFWNLWMIMLYLMPLVKKVESESVF